MRNQTPALAIIVSAVALMAAQPPFAIQLHSIGPNETEAQYRAILKTFFHEIDTKSRGYFAANDLVLPGYHIAYPPVPYPQAQLQAPFRCVDADRNGRISQQEYVDYGARAFRASFAYQFLDPVKFAHAISPKDGCK